jgi:hypothetical protein
MLRSSLVAVALLVAPIGCGGLAADGHSDAGAGGDAASDGVSVSGPDAGQDADGRQDALGATTAPDAQDEPTAPPPDLLTGGGVADPADLAVDDTSVYWFSTNAVFKVAKGGGQAFTLAMAMAGPSAIAVDSHSVYYTNGYALMSVPLGGGTPVTVVTSIGVTAALALNASHIYWANNRGPIDAMPMDAGIDGGAITQLGFGRCYPSRVAIDGISVYWADCGVSKAPLSGAGPTVQLTSSGSGRIAVDSANVYFAASGVGASPGGVFSVPVGGGTAQLLAQAQLVSGLAADGTNVYFADQAQGTVQYVPRSGGAIVYLATGQTRPRGIAVDSSFVYFGTDEGIYRASRH